MRALGPVLIAGAGVGGLTAALALHQHGIPVVVYERREYQQITGAAGFGHTIWSNATTSLARLGLTERMLDIGELLTEARSYTPDGATMFRTEIAPTLWPGATPALGIGRGDLIAMLHDACVERGIPVHYGRAVRGYEQQPDAVTVKLDDGESVTGAALVGADGIRSAVLAQLHGGTPVIDTHRSTYRGIANGTCGLHRGVVNLFSDPVAGIGGGAWQIGHNRVVWTISFPHTAGDTGETEPLRAAARATELARGLGPVPRALVANTPPETVSLTPLLYLDWLPRWGDGLVMLLGDAAHAMPTDLGQGACQAIEDGIVFGDALASAPDVRVGLARYEQRRRPRVTWIRTRVLRVNGFKPIHNPALRWVVTRIAKVVIAATATKMWREIQRPPELVAGPTG